jgi:chemotaxis protein MotB
MGRKHKHPEHENHERWLVSYADFITLLFATFTALYAIATADLAKLSKTQDTAEAISKSFQEQSLVAGIKSIIQGKSAPNANPDPLSKKVGEGPGVLGKYDSLVPKKGTVKSKEPTVDELNAMMDAVNQQLKSLAGATLTLEKGGARISLDSTLLFDSGSSSLKPRAQKAMVLIANRLSEVSRTHQLIIEGHTDNQAIHSLFYPSNWELSAARACSVVRLLQAKVKDIPANALSAVGYGDTRPKATNATLAGRAINRRIDLFIQGFAPETVKPVKMVLPKTLPSKKIAADNATVITPPAAKPSIPKPNVHKPAHSLPASTHSQTAIPADKRVATLKTVIPNQAIPVPLPATHDAPSPKTPRHSDFVPPRFEPIDPQSH